jgi:hypothetical protein
MNLTIHTIPRISKYDLKAPLIEWESNLHFFLNTIE